MEQANMDLFLDPKEFKDVYNLIKSQWEMGGGTLFAWKGSFLTPKEMEFGMGHEDTALFLHHHPYDSDNYNFFSVRSLYETLVLLKKNKLQEEDIIRTRFEYSGIEAINIGKMFEIREKLQAEALEKQQEQRIRSFCDNIDHVQDALNRAGFVSDIRDFLKIKIGDKHKAFYHVQHRELDNGEKVAFRLHFEPGKVWPEYDFTKYDLQLFLKTSIEHTDVNGIDTAHLEHQMKNMDWHFGIAESNEAVTKGYKAMEAIDLALNRLARDERGGKIAMQLWNNFVPANILKKPDFIKKSEEETRIYPKATFSAQTPAMEAYHSLKTAYENTLGIQDGNLSQKDVNETSQMRQLNEPLKPVEQTKNQIIQHTKSETSAALNSHREKNKKAHRHKRNMH